jgi:hypothetical protein
MALKFSVAMRNDLLSAITARISATAQLKMFEGAAPANITDPDSGTVIAVVEIPDTPFAAPVNGVMAKSGTWEDPAADNAGTLGHFRIYEDGGTTVLMQGTITATSGGGDMEVDNTIVAAGQTITINTLSLTAQNT